MRQDGTIEEKTQAVQRGVRIAVHDHALHGRSVCVQRNGKIIELTPAEILEELRQQEQELGITDER